VAQELLEWMLIDLEIIIVVIYIDAEVYMTDELQIMIIYGDELLIHT
jgi:hypothetical protein